jgi:hypothetical protein
MTTTTATEITNPTTPQLKTPTKSNRDYYFNLNSEEDFENTDELIENVTLETALSKVCLSLDFDMILLLFCFFC